MATRPPDGDEPTRPTEVRAPSSAVAVEQLFSQFLLAALVNLLLAALVALALWGDAPHGTLLAWLGAIAVMTLVRTGLHRLYRRTERPAPAVWVNRYLVLAGINGLLWGIAAPLFVPSVPPPQALVLVIAIAGIAAGALPVNAAVPRVYFVYLATTLTPVAGTYFVLGERAGLILGTMALLYGVALAVAGANYGRQLLHAYELAAQLNDANRELERRASHDALTGLWNRSRFETELDHELDRVTRYDSSCALIMLDIDRFKQINDTQGHDMGDLVLRRLGEILRAEVRSPDCVARWGGEEFMILLPETDLSAASWVADRLRRRIAESDFGEPGPITISLGVTIYREQEERSQLLKRLDDALYLAKQSGRNRVEAASGPHAAHGRA